MKRILFFTRNLMLAGAVGYAAGASAFTLEWEASTTVNAGNGPFAPSLIMANQGGTVTQSKGVYERASLICPLQPERRFSYSFGIDAYAQATSAVGYERWQPADKLFMTIDRRPAAVTLQQLFGEIKYRSLYLMAGMKTWDRTFLQDPLSSGDLTMSGNARPIPMVRAGFYDFVDIPLTQGWVQIIGDVAYGKFTDAKWTEDHYNYYDNFITTGVWFHYKKLYLRSKPEKPFSVTVGMQHASQFGGWYRVYRDGTCVREVHNKVNARTFLDMFIQRQYADSDIAGEALNFAGNHLGSWDLKFRYRLRNQDEVNLYVMKPWEDGTGIGWQTGFDGVWGLSWRTAGEGLFGGVVKAATLEYLDFTNQAGPFLHEPTPEVPSNPTGNDNYYNNFMYNSWVNYGMGIGSPVLKSTIYNRDGYLEYQNNMVRGFHLGVEGTAGPVDWRMLLSHKVGKGTNNQPQPHAQRSTSMMVSGRYALPRVPALSLEAKLGFDAGSLYPGCFGGLVSVTYKGKIGK